MEGRWSFLTPRNRGVFLKPIGFLAVDYRGPPPPGNFTLTVKRWRAETPGDLAPVYGVFPITSESTLSEAVTQTSGQQTSQLITFVTA